MKYFVVSDIHSFTRSLKNALRLAGFSKKNKGHTLIVCGDCFDRGDETLELYRYLKSIPKKRCILIRGNHEYLYEELLKKSFPDDYDFSNHTVDTFCQIAGYSKEILSRDYWYKLDEQNPYERIRQAWQEIRKEVAASPITAWLKSNRWKNYFELDRYIFVHSFIPLKSDDDLPSYYIRNRKFEYIANWRELADNYWYDAVWGCPYENYRAGYFDVEKTNGKTLVCGHWVVPDFRQTLLNKWSDDTSIFYFDHIIGLDGGAWRLAGSPGYYHPQNVLVIDDSDFGTCYDKYGDVLEAETPARRIETVTVE